MMMNPMQSLNNLLLHDLYYAYFTHHANKPKGDFIPVTLETDLGLQQASV